MCTPASGRSTTTPRTTRGRGATWPCAATGRRRGRYRERRPTPPASLTPRHEALTPGRQAIVILASVPTFCRHNRLIQNCPICSREQSIELRPVVSSSAPRVSSAAPSAPARPGRGRAPARGRRPAACGSAGSRAAPRTAITRACCPGLRSSDGRRAAGRGARLRRRRLVELRSAIRPGCMPRWSPPSCGPRGADVARVPDRVSVPARERRSVRGDRAGAHVVGVGRAPSLDGVETGPRTAHDPGARDPHARGLPRLGGARRLAGGRVRRRGGVDARAPLRAGVRAPRATRPAPRRALRAARHARARSASTSYAGGIAAARRRRRGHGRGQAGARDRRPAAARAARRASSPMPASVPLEALDLGLLQLGPRGTRAGLESPPARRPDPDVSERVRAAPEALSAVRRNSSRVPRVTSVGEAHCRPGGSIAP